MYNIEIIPCTRWMGPEAPVKPLTEWVFTENGGVLRDPVIIDRDEDIVEYKLCETSPNSYLGNIVVTATLSISEALMIAKRLNYRVIINNKTFAADTKGNLCAGFVKRRGHRLWLLPCTVAEAKELIKGTKKLVYWTNSKRAEIK